MKKLRTLSVLTLSLIILLASSFSPSGVKSVSADSCIYLNSNLKYGMSDSAPTVSSSQSAKYSFPLLTKSLKLGDSDQDVVIVKQFLLAENFLEGDIAVTDYYGEKTEAAVQAFQQRNNIAQPGSSGFGLVGPKTRAAINGYSHSVAAPVLSGGGQVAVLQAFLRNSGYLAPGASGYFGNQTLAAVRAFQAANAISTTGLAGPLTRERIRLISCGGQNIIIPPVNNNPVIIQPVFDLRSSVFYLSDNNTRIDYSIYEQGNSSGYNVYAYCPASITATIDYLGGNACGALTLPYGSRNFSINVKNNSSSAQSFAVRVNPINAPNIQDTETNSIPARSTSLSVVNPYSGQSFAQGESLSIRWNSSSVTANVNIELIKGGSVYNIIAYVTPSTGTYNWLIPNSIPIGNDYQIRVKDSGNSDINDISGTFSITEPAISAKSIKTFTFANPSATGVIDETNHTIAVTVPFGTVRTALVPTITTSAGAILTPLSGVARDFSTAKTYTVKALNGTTQNYVVTVTQGSGSSAKAITSFNFTNPSATGAINEANKTITLTVPFGTVVTSIAPTIAISANSTITPASGVARNFSTPKTYEVKAQDGSTETYTVTVAFGAGSSAKSLLTFDFPSLGATGVVNEAAKTVYVTIPYGVSRSSLSPVITLSQNATVSPASGASHGFLSTQVYTVKAQDNTTQDYSVTVVNANPITSSTIQSFNFTNPNITGTIGDTCLPWVGVNLLPTNICSITLTVPYGTILTSRVPVITLPPNATISPIATTARNFTPGAPNVDYVVTAQDGQKRTYRVTVTVLPVSTEAKMLTFNFTNPAVTGAIDEANHNVSLTVPFGTSLTHTPSITLSPFATVLPTAITPVTFSTSTVKDYTVKAQSGATQIYHVSVHITPGSSAKAITEFKFPSLGATGSIDEANHIITFTGLPFGSNTTLLTPSITVSANATASPGGPQIFPQSEKIYTVTAQDGSKQNYSVRVGTVLGSSESKMLTFKLNAGGTVYDAAINENATPYKTMTVNLPHNTSTSLLTATMTISPLATVFPGAGSVNLSFPNYTVTSQTGAYSTYKLIVNVAP